MRSAAWPKMNNWLVSAYRDRENKVLYRGIDELMARKLYAEAVTAAKARFESVRTIESVFLTLNGGVVANYAQG